MSISNIHVRVSLNDDNELVISPDILVFGHVSYRSPLFLHNNTSHTILIWATGNEQGGTHESSDHIEGWQELVGHGGELTLLPNQSTTQSHLKVIEQSNHFWLHTKIKTGGHGGGLSASVEIPVEPT